MISLTFSSADGNQRTADSNRQTAGTDSSIEQFIVLYNSSTVHQSNAQNVNTLADLYAEVLGVLSKSRFSVVKRRFLLEMRDLRPKESSPAVANQIICLIMGLKFFRVKVGYRRAACVSYLYCYYRFIAWS